MSETLVLLKDASWALTIPVFIIVGLRYGLFTPTEAGAIAVIYSIVIGVFAYRDLHLRDVSMIVRESVNTISIVMLIIIGASAFGYYMVWERVPAQMTAAITAVAEDPLLLLLVINLILLLVGMFLEGTAAIILLSPILVPIVTSLGVDPIQFGIVMVLNLTMGGVTPPVGTLSFTSSTVIGAPITATFKETLPFLAGLLLVLAAVTYVPPVTQFLPGLFGY